MRCADSKQQSREFEPRRRKTQTGQCDWAAIEKRDFALDVEIDEDVLCFLILTGGRKGECRGVGRRWAEL